MPGKHLYSPSHDASKRPQPKPKGSRRRRVAAEVTSEVVSTPTPVTTMFAPGQAMEPTEQQRRVLRARQMAAAIRDRDLIPDHRREYDVDGEVTHSEPKHLPPHPYGVGHGERRIITLPEDVDTELTEDELAQRQVAMQMQGQYPVRYAAGETPALKRVADQITQVSNSLGNLRSALVALKQQTQESPSAQHHSDQMILIVSEALVPWLKEVDDHAAGVVEDSKMEQRNASTQEDDDDHPIEEMF